MRLVSKPSILIGMLVLASALYLGYTYMMRRGDDEFVDARAAMVERQLKARGISDERVLEVMGRLRRHLFVDPSMMDQAYEDHPLPIAEGQTISQPYVVALMTESLDLDGSEKVLEVGTGSGYQAAVLAELCGEVYTIEIREGLAESAGELLASLEYDNVQVKCADGYFGWEEHAPFDAIIITCAVNHVPPYLTQQLKEGGASSCPWGASSTTRLSPSWRRREGNYSSLTLPRSASFP